MSCPNQNLVKLFGDVDLILNAPGSANPPAHPADGWIYYSLPEYGDRSVEGRASFNVFWGSVRNERQYFDADILEQLIQQRVQGHQNECSLVRMVVNRVELVEVRSMQEGILDDTLPVAVQIDTATPPVLEIPGQPAFGELRVVPPTTPIDPLVIPDLGAGCEPSITRAGIPMGGYHTRGAKSFEPTGMVIPFEPSGMIIPNEEGGMISPQIDLVGDFELTSLQGVRSITLHPTGMPGPIPFTDNDTGITYGNPPRPINWPSADVVPAQFIGGHTVIRDEILDPRGETSFGGFVGIDLSTIDATHPLDGLFNTLGTLPNLCLGPAANQANTLNQN